MSDPTPPTIDGAPPQATGFEPPYTPAPDGPVFAPPFAGYGAFPPSGAAPFAFPPGGHAPDAHPEAAYPPFAYPSGVYPPPYLAAGAPGQPRPSRALATTSVALAGAGLLLAFVPILTWFAAVLLVAALALAIVGLATSRQGGVGLAVGGLTMSLLGLIVSVTMTIPSMAILAAAFDDLGRIDAGSGTATGTDGTADEGVARELEVIETAVGPDPNDSRLWRYTVILENPNRDHIYEWAEIEIKAVDADGTALSTATEELMILQGTTAVAGYFSGIDAEAVDHIEVTTPAADTAAWSPQYETGTMKIEGVVASSDAYSTSVTGTVRGDFLEENRWVPVVVVARAPDGEILLSRKTHIDRLPPDDEKAPFEVDFLDVLPDDTTYEAYAAL